eukprot:1157862-Pelagomonas_calceolata.AAC.3
MQAANAFEAQDAACMCDSVETGATDGEHVLHGGVHNSSAIMHKEEWRGACAARSQYYKGEECILISGHFSTGYALTMEYMSGIGGEPYSLQQFGQPHFLACHQPVETSFGLADCPNLLMTNQGKLVTHTH